MYELSSAGEPVYPKIRKEMSKSTVRLIKSWLDRKRLNIGTPKGH